MHTPNKIRHPQWVKILGPGLITGAADDDPSGIATYSQAGAAFGFGQLWTITLCLPLMIAVQEASARIGAITGEGLVKVTSRLYPRTVLYGVVAMVVVANTINIGADIAAVGAALNLLIPLPIVLLSTIFTLVVLSLEIFIGYHAYTKFLKILGLALLAYVATALIVAEPWGEILRATVIPRIEWTSSYWYVIVGILGTTISPYMFFWQAAEEVEENALADRRGSAHRTISEIRKDTAIGMGVSQIGSWFMIVTTATVLHANGILNISTASDAAKALEPLVQGFPHAGTYAKVLFALGIIGMGLLGIPVLAGSASYSVSEALGWKGGLDLKFGQAPRFYIVIAVSTLIGLGITMIGVDPIKALVFAAVLNGLVAVPLVFLIAHISRNEKVMGEFAGKKLSRFLLSTTFIVLALCALVLIATLFL